MTNAEKLTMMGFRDFSNLITAPLRIVVCDSAPYPSYASKIMGYTTIHNDISTNTSSHGTNVCQTIKMCADFCGVEVELHYVNDLTQAIDLAMELGIKVISRSVSMSSMSQALTDKVNEFIEYGGVWVNSAGNDLQGDNAPTTVPSQAISVGCVYDSDNSGSTIVSHSAWSLPSLNGSDNIFTHTSSATPVIAFAVALIIDVYGYNFTQIKQWLYDNSIINVKDTTERLLMIGDIDMQRVIKITIGSNIMLVDGVPVTMDTKAILDANNRILVPIRPIANALGVQNTNITYDYLTKTATIIQDI